MITMNWVRPTSSQEILWPGIALDIDDVLSNTTIFWIECMIQRYGSPEWLSAKQLRDKYFYLQNIPYTSRKWQEVNDLIDFWLMDEIFQMRLKVVSWAVQTIKFLQHSWVEFSGYLSNRPQKVLNATKLRLDNHWFPSLPIILRPKDTPKQNGNHRKAKILQDNPQITGIIDDNPGLIPALSESYKSSVYLFETKNYQNPHSLEVIECKDRSEVQKNILIST